MSEPWQMGVRRDDPETSKEAAQSVEVSRQHNLIINVLKDSGRAMATEAGVCGLPTFAIVFVKSV